MKFLFSPPQPRFLLNRNGSSALVGAEVESHGDHRIAMSCAILGLLAKGRTLVKDTDCIETSYPGFAKQIALLQELGR